MKTLGTFVQQEADSSSSASKQASENIPDVILVSGEVNSGKTRLLSGFVAEMKRQGVRVAGVLSHGVWRAGAKVGIVVENITSGETRPLATVESAVSRTQQGRYRFFDDGLYFGIKALLDSAEAQVIVVDEIGPLELREQGFAEALRSLLRSTRGVLIVVVREKLVEMVIEHFAINSALVVATGNAHAFDVLCSFVKK